jgi:hypothetical protein
MNIIVRYMILPAKGGYVRLSKGAIGVGNGNDIVVEHCVSTDGPWRQEAVLPPESKSGYVSYTLSLLRLLEHLVGSENGYVRGSEEDVAGLKDLLRRLG